MAKTTNFEYHYVMAQSTLTNGFNTPLRYPGGKGKITRFVGNVLESNCIDGTYIEPFAGGAGVAINLLLAGKVKSIVINDLDDGVYSFWHTLINEPEYLLREIERVPFDYSDEKPVLQPWKYSEYWTTIRKRYDFNHYADVRRKGFDFFMLNRMNVSGIIKGGPIGGARQDGTYNISSRFNKDTLKKRIKKIADEAANITVSNLEASHFFKLLSDGKICDMQNSLIFADPPYYVQGRNLYNSYATDIIHSLIAKRLVSESDWNWLLTYDKTPQIYELYANANIKRYEYKISYSANKRGKYSEYMFASNRMTVQSYDNVILCRMDSDADLI